jgi:hypothetical protein
MTLRTLFAKDLKMKTPIGEGRVKIMAWSEWYETDSDCCQHMRRDGLKFEMIQAVRLDTTEEDKLKGLHEYVVVNDEVDLSDLDDEEVLCAITPYSYTIVSLIDTYGDAANDMIAECYLEDRSLCDSGILEGFHSLQDATSFIEKHIAEY